MKLTTEGILTGMASAILGELDSSTPDDVGVAESMQSSWGQLFPGADKIADEVLAQGKGERPTTRELSRWVNSVDCPTDAIEVMCDRMTALLGCDLQPPLKLLGGVIITWQTIMPIGDLWSSYRQAVDAGEDLRWPLAPIVRMWQQRPRPVEPSRRTTERVIPARLAMASTPSHRSAPAVQPGSARQVRTGWQANGHAGLCQTRHPLPCPAAGALRPGRRPSNQSRQGRTAGSADVCRGGAERSHG